MNQGQAFWLLLGIEYPVTAVPQSTCVGQNSVDVHRFANLDHIVALGEDYVVLNSCPCERMLD